MPYTVAFSKRADKQLQKWDAATQQLLVGYISKNLDNCEDPRALGKALAGDKAGQRPSRVGKYRILGMIDDAAITTFMFKVGHRSSANSS